MSYAFDLDDTITAAPDAFKPLMAALVKAGHNVLILSGVCRPNTVEAQWEKVERFGLVHGEHYTHAYMIDGGSGLANELQAVAAEKARRCAEHEVVLYVDDRRDWCEVVSHVCQTLQVVPR